MGRPTTPPVSTGRGGVYTQHCTSYRHDCKMAFFGLLSDMDQSKWHESPTKPDANKKKMDGGTYAAYGITNVSPKCDHIDYYLTHDNGTQRRGLLYFYERNPLKDVGHCWFKFDDRDVILGIAIEDDWIQINDAALATVVPPAPEQKVLVHQETIDMGVYGDLVHGK